nr:interferon a3-like [Nothobranchius furzeri]
MNSFMIVYIFLYHLANNSTNSTEAVEIIGFPHHLYHQASKASAKDKVAFMVQILEGVLSLFEEDHSSSSWEETTEENFLSVINQQAEELHSCIGGQGHTKMNVKLQKYFKRLSDEMLKKSSSDQSRQSPIFTHQKLTSGP